MRLKKIFKDIDVTVKGIKDVEVTGICSDSKCVAPGDLFITKKGSFFNGIDFIQEAIDAGAVAVVTDLYDPFLKVTQVIHKDVNKIAVKIASNYFKDPSKKLFMVGITGTNGKTTTSYLINHILDSGLIGSIEYILGKNKLFSTLTTPEAMSNQKYLKEMVNYGLESAVMEVSSHGIAQKRIDGIDFDVGVFTNLTQDHLDYHKTFDNYKNVKASFFAMLKKEAHSVLNKDSDFFDDMSRGKNIISYSIQNKSDFKAENIKFSLLGLEFDLFFEGEKRRVKSNLIGKFNIYNILAAIASCYIKGIELDSIIKKIASFKGVSGRLERVAVKNDFHIFIDFAHTEDSLKNVLETLKGIKHKRIITVFGCGGNRDSDKRKKMGNVVSKYSDFCFITNDNPRKEDPQKIVFDILEGVSKDNYLVELDRYRAIEKAFLLAQKDDIVLIAGKGHETFQIFANKTKFFDDKKISLEILNK